MSIDMRPQKAQCHCKNVEFGDYTNTVLMITPFDVYDMLGDKKDSNIVYIDTCIATVIGYLWHQGVVTLNSCCGHNIVKDGYAFKPEVIVSLESVEKMRELGYLNSRDSGSVIPEQTFLI